MDLKIIQSAYGNDLLVLANFKYKKEKILKSGETFWRCIKRRDKCPAKVFTIGPDHIITKKEINHNHEADISKLNRHIVTTNCKRKATEDITEKPAKLIRRELEINLPTTFTVKDREYVRKNIYNSRRKVLPGPLPKDISEVILAINNYKPKTCKGENFLFLNCEKEHIVVFSCETNIQKMCKSNQIYMDGTFTYCTKFFLQLFTLHGYDNGHYVPYMFCLLKNKQSKTYENLFKLIKFKILNDFGLNFNPKELFVDFENAIHQALKNVFPNSKINGCRFHLHQAWYRKIRKLGLADHYKNMESEIGKWLKYTFALSYLNPEDVGDCFVFDLCSIRPENEQLVLFSDYLVNTYIDENSDFPPHLWADSCPSITKTTNACESFHSVFNSSFYTTHPSIYVFIETLKEFQIDTYVKIQSLKTKAVTKDAFVKTKLRKITELNNNLKSGIISRIHFIKCISYLGLPQQFKV